MRSVFAAATLAGLIVGSSEGASASTPTCDSDNAGIALPDGFCAFTVASDLGPVRNLVVAPSGDIFAAMRKASGDGGGVVGLRDEDGDGRADQQRSFGAGDGHGIALSDSHLYYASSDKVVRWPWAPGQLEPEHQPEVVVGGFPDQREHAAKAIALGPQGELYVGVGAPSNSCQRKNREARSPGIDPCPQLERQAGIWRYRNDRANQHHEASARFATGMRHTLALAVRPGTAEVWGAINGRDQLGALWGYEDVRNAELPAEEFVQIEAGADFGWPYCYYDGLAKQKVLAPEYGGDGTQSGRCAEKRDPAIAFPAHWAPMALAFYTGTAFPERYHGGAFLAFRGSWNRAPLPQEGFRVVFVPFQDAQPTGSLETFAIGARTPTALRLTGVAVGPDGSLYLAADANGAIWRVVPSPARR